MLRAVIVDDESIIIRSLKTMIERSGSGIEVAGTADDGLTGLKLIRDLQPDIVFADISMPIMSGLQLIEICRKEGNQVPFVILSGYQEFEYAKKAIALDVLEYMVKPLNPVEFKEFLLKASKTLEEKRVQNLQEQIEFVIYAEHASNNQMPQWMEEMRFSFFHLCIGMVNYLRKMGVEQESTEREKALLHEVIGEYFGQEACLIETRYPNEFYLVTYGQQAQAIEAAQKMFDALCDRMNEKTITMVYGGGQLPLADLRKVVTGTENLLRKGAVFLTSRLLLSEADIPVEVYVGSEEIGVLCEMLSKGDLTQARGLMEQLLARCKQGLCTQKNLASILKSILRDCGEREIQTESDYYAGLLMEEASNYEDVRKGFETLFTQDSHKAEFQLNEKSCHAVLDAIAAYLAGHASEKIVMQDVAEKFGFSYTYFSYLFKKVYGQSPSEYVTQCRIEHAKQLLKQPEEISVKEIALTAGYTDPYYFSRIFKTNTGLTPSEYRRQKKDVAN